MRVVRNIFLSLMLISPTAMAGLISLDVDNFIYPPHGAEVFMSGSDRGGKLSLIIDDATLDANSDGERGRYNDAIKGGSFWNERSGRQYWVDLTASNYIDVNLVGDLYTGIGLRGKFYDALGESFWFDLWMEGSLKSDDRLDNVMSHVKIWENSIVFNMFGGGDDYFEGHSPEFVKFNTITKNLPESSTFLLLLVGWLTLGVIRRRK